MLVLKQDWPLRLNNRTPGSPEISQGWWKTEDKCKKKKNANNMREEQQWNESKTLRTLK